MTNCQYCAKIKKRVESRQLKPRLSFGKMLKEKRENHFLSVGSKKH